MIRRKMSTKLYKCQSISTLDWSSLPTSKGPFINYVNKQVGEGLIKCQSYYVRLCSKFVNERGGGKNLQHPFNVVYEWTLSSSRVTKANCTATVVDQLISGWQNRLSSGGSKKELSKVDFTKENKYWLIYNLRVLKLLSDEICSIFCHIYPALYYIFLKVVYLHFCCIYINMFTLEWRTSEIKSVLLHCNAWKI